MTAHQNELKSVHELYDKQTFPPKLLFFGKTPSFFDPSHNVPYSIYTWESKKEILIIIYLCICKALFYTLTRCHFGLDKRNYVFVSSIYVTSLHLK